MENGQPMFVGRCTSDRMEFICLESGGFVIVCQGSVLAEGPATELDSGLKRFLAMIDRPATAPLPIGKPPSPPLGRCA